MMSLRILAILIIKVGMIQGQGDDFRHEIAAFCKDNNLVPLTLVVTEDIAKSHLLALLRTLKEKGIAMNVKTLADVVQKDENSLLEQKHIILMPASPERWWETPTGSQVWQLVQRTRIGSSLLILSDHKGKIEAPASPKGNALFFVMDVTKGNCYQMLQMKNSLHSNLRKLDLHHLNNKKAVIQPDFDLTNISVRGMGLDLPGQLYLKNCDISTHVCTAEGSSWELLGKMQTMTHFSVQAHREPTNDWGAIPENETELKWTGVLGSVIHADMDIGLGFWEIRAKRIHVVEMTYCTNYKYVLAFMSTSNELDPFYLLHPFESSTYLMTFAAALLLYVVLATQRKLLRKRTVQSEGMERVLLTIAGLFFALLNAYYGGALTMFAASDDVIFKNQKLPFANLKGAIDAYPEWKIITAPGYEEIALSSAFYVAGSADLLQEQLEELAVDSLEEAVLMTIQGKIALFMHGNELHKFFELLPPGHPTIAIIDTEERAQMPGGFLLTYNSPLRPAFDWAALQIMEAGIDQRPLRNHPTSFDQNQLNSDFMPVEFNQVSIAIGVAALGVVGAALLLLIERAFLCYQRKGNNTQAQLGPNTECGQIEDRRVLA